MLSSEDIRRAVDPQVYRAGRDVLTRRLVISVLPKAGGAGCYAAVRDPGSAPYKSDIRWQPQDSGGWALRGHCSCGNAMPCRHTVAALLWLAERDAAPGGDEPEAEEETPAAKMPAPATAGPVPWLRLLRLEPAGPAGARVRDYAQLSFEYDGQRCNYGDGHAPAGLQRDAAAERRAYERLRALNLQPADPARASLLQPRSERDWLVLMAAPIPALAEDGWRIDVDPDFSFRLHEPEPQWLAQLDDQPDGDWFGLSLGIRVDDQVVPLLPLLQAHLRQHPWSPKQFASFDDSTPVILHDEAGGRWIRISAGRLKPLLATLSELFEGTRLGTRGELWLPRADAAVVAELAAAMPLQFSGNEALRRTAEYLRDRRGLPSAPVPAGLRAQLRGYQQEGYDWLQFLREQGLGGVLADDMGLGKTLQALTHLLAEKDSGRMDRPSLVIAPTSLMFNWRREAQRYAPALRVLVLQGQDRRLRHHEIKHHDLVLTTYPLLPRDFEALAKQDYHLLILDEAQNIKNAKSKAAQLVGRLRARHRLCLSGTPVENHLGEFWSLMNFLMPGYLGTEIQFRRRYRKPIEQDGDELARGHLLRRIRPFVLRRTKAEVATELPPRSDILRSVALEGAQRELYETLRLSMDRQLREEIASRGLARSHIFVLDALLKLRQVCCDPRLLKLESSAGVTESAKLDLLMDLLPEMVEEGRRVLLFSQFTSMLALIEERVRAAGIRYLKLTGETQDRESLVERFQRGETPLFLISLKAGGVGLNLTAADTVIHYDPWWNPAVEQQATDRAHRIGQDKPVFVYKLLTEGTVEQKIAEMQERKRALADALLSDSGGIAAWTEEELQSLFAPV
ncbi:MAG TPA: DEAD/DEAH box helicase [Solimonas sp.]|nr:DEAD/DEAH box helicase [Solimonas sp.]